MLEIFSTMATKTNCWIGIIPAIIEMIENKLLRIYAGKNFFDVEAERGKF